MSDLIPSQENQPEANLPANDPLDFWECMQGICLRPYKTIRRIINQSPNYGQLQLFGLLILSTALQDLKSGFFQFLLALFIDSLVWAVSIYPTIAAIWFTGKQLRGKASFTEITTAFMWAMSPIILGNVLIFAISAFVPESVSVLLSIIVFFFGLKLTIATIAEVQGFTLWQSVLNQLYAVLLLCAPAIIILILFWGVISAMAFSLIQNMGFGLASPF